jgi:hypothetical protein
MSFMSEQNLQKINQVLVLVFDHQIAQANNKNCMEVNYCHDMLGTLNKINAKSYNLHIVFGQTKTLVLLVKLFPSQKLS